MASIFFITIKFELINTGMGSSFILKIYLFA